MIALRLPSRVFGFVMGAVVQRLVPAALCSLPQCCWFLLTAGLALVLEQVMREASATDEELRCKADAGRRGSGLPRTLGEQCIVFSGVLSTCGRSVLWQ